MDELGAEEEDGEVLVVRRLTRDGRSRAQIGGVPVPIGTLARLVGTAVTVHGQSDQQRLRDHDAQREALDRFGAAEIEPLLERHRTIWRERTALTERLAELDAMANSRARSSCRAISALSTPTNATPSASSRSTWVMVKVRSNTSSDVSRRLRFERMPRVCSVPARSRTRATSASTSCPGSA